ncbi:hypothetical protein HA49_11130 [Tatumella morbirosei]|uniref:YtfJ family protein n=1 Tax=Tatumella morbirosei TaxID=642227 RepID=A0A095UEA8_9GAMM|nr:YtfJ family protein [Tatumella morbirosei]KGD72778.1 hypothetical protein HA49_11130 [Tatumella morbirosei]
MNLYRSLIMLVTVLLPSMAFAHNFVNGQPVPSLSISDRGELSLVNNEVRYQRWDSSQLAGKVRIIQYIAGRTSAKDMNSALITAVKNAAFPRGKFQATTIVNTDDAIPGTGYFVRNKIEKNLREYPWAQFIVDSNGTGRSRWQLQPHSSTIIVLDNAGRVQWAKDGALTPAEVTRVIGLVNTLTTKE